MEGSRTDVREIVNRLRHECQATERPEPPLLPPSDHVQHRAELAHLNRNWMWEVRPEFPGHGAISAGVGKAKARIARFVLQQLFAKYLQTERDFTMNLVRFQNDVAKKIDQLSDEIRLLAKALNRLSERDEILHCALEARIKRMEERAGIG